MVNVKHSSIYPTAYFAYCTDTTQKCCTAVSAFVVATVACSTRSRPLLFVS